MEAVREASGPGQDTLNRNSVQLTAASNSSPIPVSLNYAETTQTLTVAPQQLLADNTHRLTLSRTIRGVDGQPLDANGDAYYYDFPSGSETGARRVDRGWDLQAQRHSSSSKG